MPLEPILLGGLQSLEADELVPISAALIANDCVLDDRSIRGRNGYRAITSSPIAASNYQRCFFYRTSLDYERYIVVADGAVYSIIFPSSATAQDAIVNLLGTPFAASDEICGTQFGPYFYLANDVDGDDWYRIDDLDNLLQIGTLPQLGAPATAQSALTITALSGLTQVLAGGISSSSGGSANWINLDGTVGGTATYTLPATYNWSSINWLAVMCSPSTISGGNGSFRIDLGSATGTYIPLQTISDPPNTNGSPFIVFCNLQGLDPTVLGSVATLRFTQTGPTTVTFSVYGYMPVPTPPQAGPVTYYVTAFNSVTQQESILSNPVTVTYNDTGLTFPAFPAGRWNYNSWVNLGTRSVNPDTLGLSDMFNEGAGISFPTSSLFAPTRNFSGSIPVGDQWPNADTIRLYRIVPDGGTRLVKCSVYSSDGTAANALRSDGSAWTTGTDTLSDLPVNATYWSSSGTAYSITDDTGNQALAGQQYIAGGPGPGCTSMAACDSRIVCLGDPANPSTLYISNYTPVQETSGSPFPQFPAIAIDPIASGWQFNLSPTNSEVLIAVTCGDLAIYVTSTEACYFMGNLSPDAPPFKTFQRGCIGRLAQCYAEQEFFWCGPDGIYAVAGRTQAREFSAKVRRFYMSVFQPDSTTILTYQDRHLYATCGTRQLVYSFITDTWTFNTLTDTMVDGAMWSNIAYPQVTAQNIIPWNPTPSGGELLGVYGNWTKHPLSGLGPGSTVVDMAYGAGYGAPGFNDSETNDGNFLYYLNSAPALPDCDVYAQVYQGNNVAYDEAQRLGPTLRMSSTALTCYAALISPAINGGPQATVRLVKYVAGTATTIAGPVNIPNAIYPAPLCFNIRLRARGPWLIVDMMPVGINTTPVGAWTNMLSAHDTAINSAGFPGFFDYPSDSGFRTVMTFTGYEVAPLTYTTSPLMQMWFLSTSGYVMRWQPGVSFADPNRATTDNGAAIPDWEYSTGFAMKETFSYGTGYGDVNARIRSVYCVTSGALSATVYKDFTNTNGRTSLFATAGQFQAVSAADLVAYALRLNLKAANSVQCVRLAWERQLVGKDGA